MINNGIDLIMPDNKKEKKSEPFKILAVANIWAKEKGIEDLLKITERIDEDIEVTIIGKIPYKYKIKLKNRCNLIERTDNKEKLIELYCNHDLFINPTLQDNYPTVNLESISCGLPIVTYNTGGSVETINRNTGVIIEKCNIESFAETINRIKDNYIYDRKKIIEESKKYSKEKMISNYMELYYNKVSLRDRFE